MKNNVLTTQELSRYLKLNEKTILKMVKSGELPGVKIANQWRFYLSVVDKYLQNKIVQSLEQSLSKATKDIMPLSRLIEHSFIILDLKSNSRDGVLYELAKIAEDAGIAISAEDVFEQLQNRENMLSTAVGNCIAIPHPRNPSEELFRRSSVIIARSLNGVDFSSPDGKKVHLFFMACATDITLHLKLLSKIAKLLESKNVFYKFMNANSKEDIIKILLESERITIVSVES